MIMKKKIIIAAGILVVIAVGAGVYLNHPSGGGVDQEILARLAGQYGIPYDDDMDDDAYYDNECFWEMVIFTEPDEFFTTKPPVLMIYDAEAGDPGLAGTIVELQLWYLHQEKYGLPPRVSGIGAFSCRSTQAPLHRIQSGFQCRLKR